LLKWMIVAASLAGLATALIGDDLVPAVLGTAYAPVAASLQPLSLALFALAVSGIGRLSALVVDRPWLSATAAAAELLMFWSLGLLLVSRYGSTGMGWAALAGTATYAGLITWQMRAVLPYSPREAAEAAGLAALFLPLVLLRGSAAWNLALLAAAVAGYVAMLLWRGVITMAEMRALRSAVRRGRTLESSSSPATEAPDAVSD
jgi:O-antigen/teichoic acid export membrane protein